MGLRGRRGIMPNSGSSSETLEILAERLRRLLAAVPPLGSAFLFDLGAEGRLHVDARRRPASVTFGPGPAACTLSMTVETLERIVSGDLDGTTAFMQGEMTISGDVELAVRLNELLTQALAAGDGGASGA